MGAILQSPCPSVRPSVHTFVTDISASTGAILQSYCLSVRSHFHNRYLSFYWKKWFYIWYMALAWWLVPCLPFPGLPHIYFLFTVQLTNEWVGVFLARCSVQHLVYKVILKQYFFLMLNRICSKCIILCIMQNVLCLCVFHF